MSRQSRISELVSGSHNDEFETGTCQFLDLSECFDLMFETNDCCSDIQCDCCGDIMTTTSIISCIRIILGTDHDNFFQIPGVNWDLLRTVPLNSSGFRTVNNEFQRLLREFNVTWNIEYEDQQFCVNIEVPDENEILCVRTFDGTIVKLSGTQNELN